MHNKTITAGLLAALGLSLIPACLNAGSPAIPWSQIGAKAGADYGGDGLAVSPSAQGARLRCVFQRLEGEATREGLWLTSTVTNAVKERFRVLAVAVGRQEGPAERGTSVRQGVEASQTLNAGSDAARLPDTGTVTIDAQTVRFTRPGLMEEYSVSMDGVRQDFVVSERPAGAGELAVRLAVSGARVEPAVFGAQLVLDNSGRKITYNRLRVTDATGRELTARVEVESNSESRRQKAEISQRLLTSAATRSEIPNSALVVMVKDADAVYPVRIDPTFSDANWSSMGGIPGADSLVLAVAVDSAGNIYIGGGFTAVGETIVNHIAKWNGNSWSALGSGMNSGDVSAVAVSGSNVYAAGQFTNAGGIVATNIAKWNGSSWSALDSGLSGPDGYPFYGGSVSALAVLGSNVYAAGHFTTAGSIAATNIAKWNGSGWSTLGSGMSGGTYPSVSALAVSGSDLYVGGYFTTAGGIAATNIAKWNGNIWSALGSGMDTYGYVYALAAFGSNVYAGGYFTLAGGIPAAKIAKWDGSSWSALGSGMSGGEIRSLAVSGNNVYAGGYFGTAGGIAANYIAKWDGSSWSALGSGVSGFLGQYGGGVSALAVLGSDLYAGGAFSVAGENTAFGIAKWGGSSWSALGLDSRMNGFVNALAAFGSDLYVGGDFTTTAGGTAANYIAKWDGNSWSALGSGMNGVVRCLAVSGSNVYAGGGFTNAGGIGANFIAKWNGSSWSAMGAGMNSDVEGLAMVGNDLYAGGYFTRAGGGTVNYIAKWNGSSWSHVGTGISGAPVGDAPNVFALVSSGSDLYVGGFFQMAGGIPAANIAKWDGSSWSALGSGMDNIVYALAVSGSDLYAGGAFFTAGGTGAAYVAKWDGNSWWALDSGVLGDFYYSGGIVFALAVSGSDVYVGGAYVTMPDGSPATNIAKWDGSSWSALGSGVNGDVSALAVVGNDLYAGGGFTTAGGKVSEYIARAYLLPLPTLSVSPSSIPQGGITVSWPSADTDGFTLQAGTPSAPASWVSTTASVTDDGTTRSVTLPATNSAQFFRLRRP